MLQECEAANGKSSAQNSTNGGKQRALGEKLANDTAGARSKRVSLANWYVAKI